MRLITKWLCAFALLLVAGNVSAAKEYEVDQKFTDLSELLSSGTLFSIVNETDGKGLCFGFGDAEQNMYYETFTDMMSSKSYTFKVEAAQGDDVAGYYYLRPYKPDGTLNNVWGWGGYFNSQKASDWCCFCLGLNNQNGQDLKDGAVWAIEASDGKFALKNVGTGKYLKDAAPAKYDDATYFTFCTLKEKASTDPLAEQKDALEAAIAKGKMFNALAYTEATFTALGTAVTNGETALAAADATAESLTTATTAINDAITALALKDGFTSLKDVDFGVFDGWGATAKLTQKLDPTWDLFKATGQSYGDPSVNNRADVSAYDKLYVVAVSGSPRILLNRDADNGQWNETESDSHLIDNTKGGWSAKYFSTENGITTVDLKQLVTDKGFAHLTAIKSYDNNVISGLYLYKAPAAVAEDTLPIDIQFGANYNEKGVQNYTSTWTATKDGKTWTIVNFNNNNNGWNLIKCGSKSGESVASITSPAIFAEVKAYTISLTAAANVNSAKLTMMNGEEKVGEDIDITESFVAGEVVVPVEGQKGYSYVLTINNAQGSGNGSVQISKITLSGEVKEPVHIANTAETAYTVAKAIELIDAGEALSETVFVKGIVSQVDSYSDEYKNITYWISDDGKTEGAQFECFRGKSIDGADFASINDVEVGAEVVVTGILQKYGETYELSQGNALVSYKAPFKPLFADGKYYIYNVGAQKYLAAGANWGTHAVVNADGLDYIITATDGKYTLDSQVSNGGNSHFLNGEWNDGAAFGWTIAKVSDGIFTISNGENFLTAGENGIVTLAADATVEAAHWTMKTLDERLAELAAATVEAPVDATFLIQDADFGRNDLRKSAWKMEASNQNLSGGEDGNGTVGNNNAESYHSTFTLSQTLSKAPAGKYKMTAQGFYRQDDNATEDAPVFYANEKTAEFPAKTGSENSMTDAAKSFSAGQYTIDSIDVTVFEDGLLTIGAKGTATHQWVIFDNFRLTYLSSEIPADEFKPAYENALAAAQAALADEAYAAVTGEEKTALQQAIDDNKEIAEPTSDLYKAAISALNAATSNFTGAKGAYDALNDAKTEIVMVNYSDRFPYASEAKKAAALATLDAEATNAADATAKTAAIYKAYRQFAESNAMLEGVEGAVNMTDVIVNPKAEEAIAEPWKVVLGEGSGGALNILNGEPWTDGDDNATHKYFDGGDWGAQAWNVGLEQKIALPAGKYMLTVKGRASADVALKVFAGTEEGGIPSLGASGALFGRGWNDASVEFELAEADSIAIGVRGVTEEVHNWMSFSDFRLYQFPAEVKPEPQPVDPDLVEIPQEQQDQEAGVVTLATFEKDEKTGVTTYTTKDNVCVIFKMKNVDVSDCDYILFKFAEPTPAGLKYAFWTNNKNNDLPAGVTEFKYVFAEDNENEIKDGIIPEVSLLTIFAEAGKVVKVAGVYKHKAAPVEVAHTWDFTKWSEATVANLIADAAASKVAGWSDVEKKADAEADADPTEASKDNCFWAVIPEGGELTANGEVIAELKGLQFGATFAGNRSLAIAVNYPETSLGTYAGPSYLWLGGKNFDCFTIPAVKGGTTITMGVESHKITDARGVKLFADETELMGTDGNAVAAPTTYTEQTWTVPAGVAYDIVVKNTNGCHIYFIDAEQDQEVLTSISTVKTNKQLNGTIFNLNGQKVNKAQKGLYIINGKKVVVK